MYMYYHRNKGFLNWIKWINSSAQSIITERLNVCCRAFVDITERFGGGGGWGGGVVEETLNTVIYLPV